MIGAIFSKWTVHFLVLFLTEQAIAFIYFYFYQVVCSPSSFLTRISWSMFLHITYIDVYEYETQFLLKIRPLSIIRFPQGCNSVLNIWGYIRLILLIFWDFRTLGWHNENRVMWVIQNVSIQFNNRVAGEIFLKYVSNYSKILFLGLAATM